MSSTTMTDVSFKRINSSRFLIYAPINVEVVATTSTPVISPPPVTPLSSTARRIIRKRSSYIRVIANNQDQLISLGTVDITPSTLLPYIIPSFNKPKRSPTASPTNPLSPQTSKKPSPVPSSSSVAHRSTAPEPFKVVIASRPAPRLPLFHPGNTDPLPEIEKPQVLAPTPANNPPRRSSARARKPAAKALALSLGQGSDGSGLLDSADASKDSNASPSNDKSSSDGAVEERNQRSPSAAKPVKEEIINNNTAEAPSSTSAQPTAPKTRRGGVKRKAALVDPIVDDDSSSTPANKRPRRGVHNSDVAPVHAPSPLANEVARGSSQGSETTKKRTAVTPVASSKEKEKVTAAGLVSPAQSTTKPAAVPKAKPPPSVKSKPATSAKSASSKVKEPEPTKSRMRSNSSSLSPVSDQPAVDTDDTDKKKPSKFAPAQDDEDDEEEEEEEEDKNPKFQKINIFSQPIELKPRPRPTYKMHLKRISTTSLGDDVSGSGARKRRNSKTHSRKNSEAVNALGVPISPIKDKDSTKESPVEKAKSTQDDDMDVDPVAPSVEVATGSIEAADSTSNALQVVA